MSRKNRFFEKRRKEAGEPPRLVPLACPSQCPRGAYSDDGAGACVSWNPCLNAADWTSRTWPTSYCVRSLEAADFQKVSPTDLQDITNEALEL